jgi:transposase
MESSSTAVVTLAAKSVQRKKRQQRSITEKRQIVEETMVAGASVAQVARAHGINANQVFAWRRLHQAGRLVETRSKRLIANPARLLPVKISEQGSTPAIAATDPAPLHSRSTVAASSTACTGTIHIQFSRAQVRIEGSADPATLRVIVELLSR